MHTAESAENSWGPQINLLKEFIIPMNLQIFIKIAPTNMIQLNDCAYRIMNVNPFVCLRFHKFSINE